MVNSENSSPALHILIQEDAVGQLCRREGRMAKLGSEDGALKLDWVEGVERLLADATKLEEVEAQAREIWQRGIRHVIWAGMGGSVMAVRVLTELGFCSGSSQTGQMENAITIYPLDSTDPAALNEIVRELAEAKKLPLPHAEAATNQAFLRTLLEDVLMVGVSMGMTSEEPITHLTWYSELLEQAQLSAAEHLLVMTLPGSYLDAFASEHQVPSLPLQLDGGTGTGGRMSAPTTRVFLLPVALYLISRGEEIGQLRTVLRRSWQVYNLEQAARNPAEHSFVRLAAALSDASIDGACRLLLELPDDWHPLLQWVEQLMEESLGKGSKGVVVFQKQLLKARVSGTSADGILRVRCTAYSTSRDEQRDFVVFQPYLAWKEPLEKLAAVAASFLGWQLSMALYGYLQNIPFAGQPAVENYKARARKLRALGDPLQTSLRENETLTEGKFTLFLPRESIDESRQQAPDNISSLAVVIARALRKLVSSRNGYLDLTINGEAAQSLLDIVERLLHTIGNELLGVPVKMRRAPAAYHSTEQSEMDGPPELVSLRLLARNTEESLLGTYTNTFLRAQAISTEQAMIEQGRTCFLLVMNCFLNEEGEPLERFFDEIATSIRSANEKGEEVQ